jgi:hypothetical protein
MYFHGFTLQSWKKIAWAMGSFDHLCAPTLDRRRVAEEKIECSWEGGSSPLLLAPRERSGAVSGSAPSAAVQHHVESMTHAECLAMIRAAGQQMDDDEGTN